MQKLASGTDLVPTPDCVAYEDIPPHKAGAPGCEFRLDPGCAPRTSGSQELCRHKFQLAANFQPRNQHEFISNSFALTPL